MKLILTQEEIITAIREYLCMMCINHMDDIEIDDSHQSWDETIATVTYRK
jgi:hypothetical protein